MKIIRRFIYIFFVIYILLYIPEFILTKKNSQNLYSDIGDLKRSYDLIYEKLYNNTSLDYYNLVWKYHDQEIEPKGDKKRILFVGDSFTWGFTNSNPNSLYWKQLQYYLEQEGYNDIEIIAACFPGLSSYDEYEYVLTNDTLLEKIDPDLIIVQFLYNDYQISDENDPLYLKKVDASMIVNHITTNNIFFNITNKIYPEVTNYVLTKYAENLITSPNYNDKYGKIYGYNYWDITELDNKYKDLYFERYKNDFVDKLNNVKYPLVIFNTDWLDESLNNFEHEFVDYAVNLFKENNIPLIYNSDEFYALESKYLPEKLYLSEGDPWHPSALVDNFYANTILDYLKENYADLLGTKSEVKEFGLEINDYMPYNINFVQKYDNEFEFVWSLHNKKLNYFTKKTYVKFNLKYPIKIKSIEVDNDNAEVWINPYYEQNNYIKLRNEGNIFYVDDSISVESISIHINSYSDTKVNFKINY